MKDLLRIASLLDNYEQFRLSDKLFKIAQASGAGTTTQDNTTLLAATVDTLNSDTMREFGNNLKIFAEKYNYSDLKTAMDQYANAGATFKGVPISRNTLTIKPFYVQHGSKNVSELPRLIQELYDNGMIDSPYTAENPFKPDAQWEADGRALQQSKLVTYNPEDFVEKLFVFSEQNEITNLVQAFDAFANAGASYQAKPINRDPILREVYMRVKNTGRMITKTELVNEIKILSGDQGAMNNQAASMRAQMPVGQAYGTFTQAINNSKSLQELDRYKKEINFFDNSKFDQNDKNALFNLIKEKETEISSYNQQESADSYKEFLSLVQQEPLNGLETLKTEIQNNQYLTEQQKTQLNNMIEKRITNRK
jgi:hypothetical protein